MIMTLFANNAIHFYCAITYLPAMERVSDSELCHQWGLSGYTHRATGQRANSQLLNLREWTELLLAITLLSN